MSKLFYFTFGSGGQNPNVYTGLSPTFIVFSQNGNTPLTSPTIAELTPGSGIYGFTSGTTASIALIIDGGATLSTLSSTSSFRYIRDAIDPILAVDQSVGYNTDSFGSTASDPTTLFGQAKRNQEFNEGDKYFTKSTGLWDNYNRGSTTLLFEKALTNTTTSATSTV